MKTDAWGRHMWYSIHFIALAFPENPTNEEKRHYQYFFENLHTVLPCYKCSLNYVKHLQEIPINVDVLQNATNLFNWTVDIHNLVNKELGKRIWSRDEALEYYTNFNDEFNYGSCFTLSNLLIVIFIIIIIAILTYLLKAKLYS